MDAGKSILARASLILGSLITVFGLSGCLSKPDTAIPMSPGRTLYVSKSPDCAGRHPCYASIQEAVHAAAEGDVVKVAEGMYGTTASQVVSIEHGLRLLGGFRSSDWSLPGSNAEPTIIDAEGVRGRRGIVIDGTDVSTITVSGFRIRGGGVNVDEGGGIYVGGGSVVLEDNVIEECSADARGGGLFVAGGSVRLTRNVLRGNSARYGGGLYVDGGSVVLEGNRVLVNEAGPIGGAIALGGGSVVGTNDVVADNALAGAGVYLSAGRLMASHWTLVDNGRYGIMADLGIEIESGSAALLKSIVALHQSGLCGSGAAAQQTLFHQVDQPCIAGASCVNNLFGDPKFVDPANGDYHIARDSAAVDRGYNLEVFRDMDGDTRPVGMVSDIGADEIEPNRMYLPLIVRLGDSSIP